MISAFILFSLPFFFCVFKREKGERTSNLLESARSHNTSLDLSEEDGVSAEAGEISSVTSRIRGRETCLLVVC